MIEKIKQALRLYHDMNATPSSEFRDYLLSIGFKVVRPKRMSITLSHMEIPYITMDVVFLGAYINIKTTHILYEKGKKEIKVDEKYSGVKIKFSDAKEKIESIFDAIKEEYE